MFSLLRYLPKITIVWVAFIAVTVVICRGDLAVWNAPAMAFPILADIDLTHSDVFIASALLILMIDLLNSTTATNVAIGRQIGSLIVFMLAGLGFTLDIFACGVYFVLLVMNFVEVVTVFVIMITAARKDIAIGGLS